jgi:hypothetical protein
LNQERAKRKANDVRQKDYAEMEKPRDENAREKFKRPAYQAAAMIRQQGKQIEHNCLMEYLAEKYDIGKGVDAGGQKTANAIQGTFEREAQTGKRN